jgi:hypothetical protein
MVNYENGKIYKIVCNKTGKFYIGSTTKLYLSQRLQAHLDDFFKWKNGFKRVYLTSFLVLENDDFDIEMLESCSCKSKDELHSREKFYIRMFPECVNKVIPQRTRLEYREEKKDKIKAYAHEYSARKFFCEFCKIEIGVNKKARHEKTRRHLVCKENCEEAK